MKQVHDLFGDISTFLMNEELPAITTKKLLAIIDDLPSLRKLKELAVTIDAMEPFVKATYELDR